MFPGSEIYGGLASAYNYGPLGVELKNNIKREWWKYFIQEREDVVRIGWRNSSEPKNLGATGHVKNFKVDLVECKKYPSSFPSG